MRGQVGLVLDLAGGDGGPPALVVIIYTAM